MNCDQQMRWRRFGNTRRHSRWATLTINSIDCPPKHEWFSVDSVVCCAMVLILKVHSWPSCLAWMRRTAAAAAGDCVEYGLLCSISQCPNTYIVHRVVIVNRPFPLRHWPPLEYVKEILVLTLSNAKCVSLILIWQSIMHSQNEPIVVCANQNLPMVIWPVEVYNWWCHFCYQFFCGMGHQQCLSVTSLFKDWNHKCCCCCFHVCFGEMAQALHKINCVLLRQQKGKISLQKDDKDWEQTNE